MTNNGTGHKKARWLLEVVILLAALVLIGVLLRSAYHHFMRTAYPRTYAELVEEQAQATGLEPSLLYAIIRTESNFHPEAVSSAGAVGLMQLTADTFMWAQSRTEEEEILEAEQLFDPAVNIRYGALVVTLLEEQFHSRETVIAAYNAGIGNVRKWLQDEACSRDGVTLYSIPFEETRDYVQRVLDAQRMYQELYDIA